jgi:hypothetical protein
VEATRWLLGATALTLAVSAAMLLSLQGEKGGQAAQG